MPDATGVEGGHGAAKPDAVIHRYIPGCAKLWQLPKFSNPRCLRIENYLLDHNFSSNNRIELFAILNDR
jgi:hypothetical protein